MGFFRWLFGILGFVLIVLPFLPFNMPPAGSIVGISVLSNKVLSIILGVLIIIFVFWSWRSERKRNLMMYGPPYKPFNAPTEPAETQQQMQPQPIQKQPQPATTQRMPVMNSPVA